MRFYQTELSSPGKLILFVAMLMLICVVGCLDFITGYDLSLLVFYLAPILVCVWFIGRAAGYTVTVICIAVALAIEYHTGRYAGTGIFIWNGIGVSLIYFMLSHAVSGLKASLMREQMLSRTDSLTGLANSRHFYEIMKDELNRARRYGRRLTLAFIDCDGFKKINDAHGHRTGDEVLRTIGVTIRNSIRVTDYAARIGGDEFCVLLTESESEEVVLSKIRDAVGRIMSEKGWAVTLSIGAAVFKNVPQKAEDMMKKADKLMYDVKMKGKNSVKIVIY